jgi:hypothetical protein
MRYAKQTEVSTERSLAEIRKTVLKYGAEGFMYGESEVGAVLSFVMQGRQVRFMLRLPSKQDPQWFQTPTGRECKDPNVAYKKWEQACRQQWRALLLLVKAKLEAVESGITIFDQEFLAQLVLPNGQTYGDFAAPQIAMVYEKQEMPKLLPMLESQTRKAER